MVIIQIRVLFDLIETNIRTTAYHNPSIEESHVVESETPLQLSDLAIQCQLPSRHFITNTYFVGHAVDGLDAESFGIEIAISYLAPHEFRFGFPGTKFHNHVVNVQHAHDIDVMNSQNIVVCWILQHTGYNSVHILSTQLTSWYIRNQDIPIKVLRLEQFHQPLQFMHIRVRTSDFLLTMRQQYVQSNDFRFMLNQNTFQISHSRHSLLAKFSYFFYLTLCVGHDHITAMNDAIVAFYRTVINLAIQKFHFRQLNFCAETTEAFGAKITGYHIQQLLLDITVADF